MIVCQEEEENGGVEGREGQPKERDSRDSEDKKNDRLTSELDIVAGRVVAVVVRDLREKGEESAGRRGGEAGQPERRGRRTDLEQGPERRRQDGICPSDHLAQFVVGDGPLSDRGHEGRVRRDEGDEQLGRSSDQAGGRKGTVKG